MERELLEKLTLALALVVFVMEWVAGSATLPYLYAAPCIQLEQVKEVYDDDR